MFQKYRRSRRLKLLDRLFAGDQVKIAEPSTKLVTDPVYIEFNNKFQLCLYVHTSSVEVLVNTAAEAYVVALMLTRLSSYVTLKFVGVFSYTSQIPTKPLSLVRTTSNEKDRSN